MAEKLVIVGAGVAGVNAATKLVDNGFPGKNITIIDMGKDPYRRPYSEVMTGFLGAGGWSDGKLTYHTAIWRPPTQTGDSAGAGNADRQGNLGGPIQRRQHRCR